MNPLCDAFPMFLQFKSFIRSPQLYTCRDDQALNVLNDINNQYECSVIEILEVAMPWFREHASAETSIMMFFCGRIFSLCCGPAWLHKLRLGFTA